MSEKLILAVPSKGRLMDKTINLFAGAGMHIVKTGHERGYRGKIEERDDVEVAFLSASEIAANLRRGEVHLGVTGEDLLRELMDDMGLHVEIAKRLGFGHADVIVAVPASWLDVRDMADLDEVALAFHARHGRRLRVATKYLNLTRRFFASHGLAGYRIVESLGATEGAPAAGTAQAIVDITSTGSTLVANHLKILEDGLILKSEAVLAASRSKLPEVLEKTREHIHCALNPR
jgi:ATP phosphoribosyltransferase